MFFQRVQNDCVAVSFWFQHARKTPITRSHVLFIVSQTLDMLHSFVFSFLNNNNQKYKFHCQIFQREWWKTFESLWIQTFTTQNQLFIRINFHHLIIIIVIILLRKKVRISLIAFIMEWNKCEFQKIFLALLLVISYCL